MGDSVWPPAGQDDEEDRTVRVRPAAGAGAPVASGAAGGPGRPDGAGPGAAGGPGTPADSGGPGTPAGSGGPGTPAGPGATGPGTAGSPAGPGALPPVQPVPAPPPPQGPFPPPAAGSYTATPHSSAVQYPWMQEPPQYPPAAPPPPWTVERGTPPPVPPPAMPTSMHTSMPAAPVTPAAPPVPMPAPPQPGGPGGHAGSGWQPGGYPTDFQSAAGDGPTSAPPFSAEQLAAAPVIPMPASPHTGPNGQGVGTDDTPSSPWAQPPAVPAYRPGVDGPPFADPAPTSPGAAPSSPAVFFPGQPPAVHPGGHAGQVPVQQQPVQPPVQPPAAYQQAPVQYQPAPVPHPQPQHPADDPNAYVPTAEEFARRRVVRPSNPVATMGMRGALRKSTFGLVKPGPGRKEQEHRHLVETIRRNFGGLRQVTIVNPKGGAGKTVAVLLMSMTFGQKRGGYILAWDNNETQGTLGMRAQQDFHSRTVRDLMRDLDHFHGAHGRVGDLSQYVRSQGEGMFDVLASDESATAGEMLTAQSFGDLREVVSRFYKLIFVDTGNNVRAENWQAAIDATDQLVVTMSARNDSAETAARMLDHLEQNGRHRLVRQAVTVVSMPPSRRDLDVPSITRHFAARTRTVMLAPYEKLIDSGEPIRYAQLSAPTRLAWLRIGAAVAEGL